MRNIISALENVMKRFLTPISLLITISVLLISLARIYQNKTMPAGKRRAWIVVLIGTILITLCLFACWIYLTTVQD